jgi:Cytochrome c554 and c-prime
MLPSMRLRLRAACAATATVLLAAAAASGADLVQEFIRRHWSQPLAPQGPPPARFSLLEASLHPESCGTCHPAQLADWRESVHAAASGPGVAGQLVEMRERDPSSAHQCLVCHAPLAEQAPLVAETLAPNPAFDAALRARGIPCAACHVRGHARFGPPRRDGSLASTAPRETLPHGGVTRTPAYLASEFCRGCHQFEPDGFALNGTLLENTYAEWKASRFAAAGVQCQNCHMPDRRHLWRGIHDPDMVRSGLTITLVEDEHPADAVSSRLVVENSGVGHRFPTYVTPLVILRAELLDARARPLPGSRVERRIGREVTLDLEREVSDTRLAPGERTELPYAGVLDGDAVAARFSVLVYPDAFYTAFFESLLRQGAGRGEDDIRRALDDSRRSAFVVFEKVISRRGRLSPRP